MEPTVLPRTHLAPRVGRYVAGLALAAAARAGAQAVPRTPPRDPPRRRPAADLAAPGRAPRPGDGRPTVYFEFQVEQQAALVPGTMSLEYPDSLRRQNVGGRVVVQFVVDTLGRALFGTDRVVESAHPLFARAALSAIAEARFTPARVGGRVVRQLVLLPLQFAPAASAPPAPSP